jgi:hypothetical protein
MFQKILPVATGSRVNLSTDADNLDENFDLEGLANMPLHNHSQSCLVAASRSSFAGKPSVVRKISISPPQSQPTSQSSWGFVDEGSSLNYSELFSGTSTKYNPDLSAAEADAATLLGLNEESPPATRPTHAVKFVDEGDDEDSLS